MKIPYYKPQLNLIVVMTTMQVRDFYVPEGQIQADRSGSHGSSGFLGTTQGLSHVAVGSHNGGEGRRMLQEHIITPSFLGHAQPQLNLVACCSLRRCVTLTLQNQAIV